MDPIVINSRTFSDDPIGLLKQHHRFQENSYNTPVPLPPPAVPDLSTVFARPWKATLQARYRLAWSNSTVQSGSHHFSHRRLWAGKKKKTKTHNPSESKHFHMWPEYRTRGSIFDCFGKLLPFHFPESRISSLSFYGRRKVRPLKDFPSCPLPF